MERKYYTINEETARTANDVNSFREYTKGSATNEYRGYVDKAYDVAEKVAEKKPHLAEKAERMAGRYSRKMAEYLNAYYRNEASCPSILVSGGSNFPVKKKDKQNSRRETLMNEWSELQEYAQKIENLLYMEQPILSGDEQAVELLEEKLAKLEELQETMKNVNAYYRKNKTLDGCPDLTVKQIETAKAAMSKPYHIEDKPFASYELTNNNANINRIKKRIETLKKEKESGTRETENQFFRVVENKELMRLQLIFDGKPEQEVRELLKAWGFRWAPSQEAWQRTLTNNARYALKQILKELEKSEAGEEAVANV